MGSNSPFEWKDFNDLADILINLNTDAAYRTAINRYYFSSFCISRDYLILNKIFRSKKSKNIMISESSEIHKETREIFRNAPFNHDEYIGDKIYRALTDLREKRNKFDYDKNASVNLNLCNYCKSRSEIVFENIEKF